MTLRSGDVARFARSPLGYAQNAEDMRSGNTNVAILVALLAASCVVHGQDYEVSGISCSFGLSGHAHDPPHLRARLRKPAGFKGAPIFADDRRVDPSVDAVCQIRRDLTEPSGLAYLLNVTDIAKCGVVRKNGFINARVWFPKLSGVVMMSDQEVIIMCKPPESTVTSKRTASFAGQIPAAARVSGVVEEAPEKLRYEVALFKESKNGDDLGQIIDQAVPIGTRLQLRATIGSGMVWRHAKLLEVSVSNDSTDAYSPGHIKLIENGCRVEEFASIVPRQPYHPSDADNEVRMEFEAVLLDAQSMERASQLWIHARIKACVVQGDCAPDDCGDAASAKAGRSRRETDSGNGEAVPVVQGLVARNNERNFFPVNDASESASFDDNIGLTVIVPADEYSSSSSETESPLLSASVEPPSMVSSLSDCRAYVTVAAILGGLSVVASAMMCVLALRLHRMTKRYKKQRLQEVVREHRRKFGFRPDEFMT